MDFSLEKADLQVNRLPSGHVTRASLPSPFSESGFPHLAAWTDRSRVSDDETTAGRAQAAAVTDALSPSQARSAAASVWRMTGLRRAARRGGAVTSSGS